MDDVQLSRSKKMVLISINSLPNSESVWQYSWVGVSRRVGVARTEKTYFFFGTINLPDRQRIPGVDPFSRWAYNCTSLLHGSESKESLVDTKAITYAMNF
jgi:hypothetical protein